MTWRTRLAWSWTVAIAAVCWFPHAYMNGLERGPRPFLVPNFDKLVHMGIFAVFAVLWMRADWPRSRAGRVFLAGLALAVITELGQELPIVNRDANVGDTLADLLGLIVGLVGYGITARSLEKRPAGPEV